jgi:hypothetical protein
VQVIELERAHLSPGARHRRGQEPDGQNHERQPPRPDAHVKMPPVFVSFDFVQIKWLSGCRLSPDLTKRMRRFHIRISILMVNHRLLKPKCGNTVAISRQK